MAINQTLQHKRSTVPGNQPTTSQVDPGELAINFADQSIYTSDGTNILELSRDVHKGLTQPSSPYQGTLWYNTTTSTLYSWDGSNWVTLSYGGLPVLATNITTSATSGTGTSANPLIYSTTAPLGTTTNIDNITITGLAPGQIVPIVDLNSSANGGRFVASHRIADNAGILRFRIDFIDEPPSTISTSYTAEFKIGSDTVYYDITLVTTSAFPQPIVVPDNTVSSSTLWTAPNDILTSTGDLLISINGSTFTTGPLNITTGDTLYLKWAGNPGSGVGIDGADGTTITGSVVNGSGGVSPASLAIDKQPNAFVFTAQTGVGLSTAVTSNSVTVTGFNSYAYLTSANTMLASVDGGTFTSVPASGTGSFIVTGQTLAVRQTSSATNSTTTTVTVAVGGTSAGFSVTTGNNIVNTPSITSPISGSTGVTPSATIVASAYATTGVVGTHLNTDWQIATNSTFTTGVISNSASTVNLTSWTPSGLTYTTQYWVRVRYRSNDSTPIVSDWSPSVSWTTSAEPGVTWTTRTSGTTDSLNSVTWSGTQFVAVGDTSSSAIILTSPTGITWATQTSGTTNTQFGVTWSGTQFVTVGNLGTILTSPNGTTWTTQPTGTTNNLKGVTWSGTQFVAVGQNGAIFTSPNGTTWTSRVSGTAEELYGVTWSSSLSLFVAVGNNGAIFTSPNGTTWTTRTSGTTNSLYSITWSGTRFVIVGNLGTILTSSNGTTWTPQTSAVSYFGAVTWSGTQFLAVGSSGTILTSPDGTTWTSRTSGVANDDLYGVTWSGTQFVAVGSSGRILTSP